MLLDHVLITAKGPHHVLRMSQRTLAISKVVTVVESCFDVETRVHTIILFVRLVMYIKISLIMYTPIEVYWYR